MLVNAYILYVKMNVESVIDKNTLYQHDFRRSVALVCINPEVYWNNESNGLYIPTWKRENFTSGNSSVSVVFSASSGKS